jgi:hypothetical protein
MSYCLLARKGTCHQGYANGHVRLARKFRRVIQPTKDKHKGVFKLGYYLDDNKLRRFGFIGMCKFLDQGEGQDGASLRKKREVSVTNTRSTCDENKKPVLQMRSCLII